MSHQERARMEEKLPKNCACRGCRKLEAVAGRGMNADIFCPRFNALHAAIDLIACDNRLQLAA